MTGSRIPYVLAIVAFALAALLAYALDTAYNRLHLQANLGPGYGPTAIAPIIFGFLSLPLLAAIYLCISWLLFKRFSPTALASATYVLVGLLIYAAPISGFIVPFPPSLRGTFVDRLRTDLMQFGFESRLAHLSAFLIIVGLIGLWESTRRRRVSDSETSPGAA